MFHLDLESYSQLDVTNVGAFRYASHPSTEILIACYAEDDGLIETWTCEHLDPPMALLAAVERGERIAAHNAMFEYAVYNATARREGWPLMRRRQMVCTAAQAAMASLPRRLGAACAAMELPEQKDTDGKRLIRLFSMPQRDGSRVRPSDAPEEFARFVAYCVQDVRAERGLGEVLPPLPPREREIFEMDLKINERGIALDIPLVRKTLKIVGLLEDEIHARVEEMTGGIRTTQRDKLMRHLNLEGVELDDLKKETLKKILKTDLPAEIREIISLRIEGSKASTKKLAPMIRCADEDHRARGTCLYHGAHTGRWTGKLIQPHNFIRGLLSPAERATVFNLLAHADTETFKLFFDEPMSAISQCMRGFIVAHAGKRLLVVDYKQIELRILLWLARELAGLERIRQGVDLYRWMGQQLYNVPTLDEVTDDQRRNGKNLILGCGFGLGAKKFVEYSDNTGVVITEEFAKFAVGFYRDRHPNVKRYWGAVSAAAIAAVEERGVTRIRQITFDGRDKTFFRIYLPSGRALYYPYPEVNMVKARYQRNGKDVMEQQLSYKEEFRGSFIQTSTYGGKLVENIVQGVARDVMAEGMLNAEKNGYPIVLTVHDEILSEKPDGEGSVDEFARIACDLPAWIEDCPVEADGFEAKRYRKG